MTIVHAPDIRNAPFDRCRSRDCCMLDESVPDEITIQLVDPSDGRQLQAWSFEGVDSITIGRGDDQRVTLADPYVSRRHAELRRNESGWRLIALGRSGVFVSGSSVTDIALSADTIFRLGSNGPALRYQMQSEQSGSATLSFDPECSIFLQMDRRQLEAEARDVVETDYFQRLQQTARELRRQRTNTDEPDAR